MKQSYSLFLILILFLLLYSCASHKAKQQTQTLTFPELSSIIETKGKLWYSSSEQVGRPMQQKPLQIRVQQLPFNKASYAAYSKYMQKASKINSIAYVDSLPYKPKYLRLQVLDKIKLVQLLNSDENKNVRSYLAHNDTYKLVTQWDITMPDNQMVQLLEADAVFLKTDHRKKTQLTFMHGSKKQEVNLSEIEVFSYGFSSFCWGEDRYHNRRIENLLSGNAKCPKGTFKKASKVVADKSYLKF